MKLSALVLVNCLIFNSLLAAENDKSGAPGTVPSGFQLKKGFRIQLVASDNLVEAPVAMAFDENGRLFVAEMRDYPDRRAEKPHLGRIRVLEDADNDGVFDSSAVYADNLAWPSAIACFGGGVFVAAAPEILYLKDGHKDGVADIRRVIFQGFGGEEGSLRIDALPNNFNWSLDNRIYGAAAGIGGTVNSTTPSSGPVELGRHDFSFDPKALTIAAESGTAESGCTFDIEGRRFTSDYARPLRDPQYPLHYLARNPSFPKAPESADVEGGAAPIFRFSPEQAPGTAARRADGLVAGWPTRTRGGVIYRGGIFPPNYQGNYFVPDSAAGVIHRGIVREKGLGFTVERAPDELNTEFLISRDPEFQPVQVINGPEGGLYIADLHGGNGKGRIYRIIPEKLQWPKPRLGKAKPYDLVAALASPNGWQSDTASRLLYEFQDPSSGGLLTNMVNNSKLPMVRSRALHALNGLGALNEQVVVKGLRDADAGVREHAVMLSEKLVREGTVSDTLWNALKALSGDPSIRVRCQLAFALGEIHRTERDAILADILRRDYANRWIQTAVFSSLWEGAGNVFVTLANDGALRASPEGLAVLQQLLAIIGLQAKPEEAARVFDFLDRAKLEPRQSFTFLYYMGEGLRRGGNGFPLVDRDNRLQTYYDQTVLATVNDSLPEPVRLAAIRLRGVSPRTLKGPDDYFDLLFGTGQSEAVQTAVISALARYDNPGVPANILSHWSTLTPAVRTEGVAALLSRTDGVPQVIAALQDGRITRANLTQLQANFLRTHPNNGVSQAAVRMLGPVSRERGDLVEKFQPVLHLAGNAASGRRIFTAQCASCHRLNGEGQTVGPDLAAARTLGKGTVLSAILEPNRTVRPDYLTYVVVTKGGENLVGLITDENPRTITIRRLNGEETVHPRTYVESITPQTWSMMPEGFEDRIPLQGMADLLEYVCPPAIRAM